MQSTHLVNYNKKIKMEKNYTIINIIEKKIRKNIRTEGNIDKQTKIILINDNSQEFEVTKFFINKILKYHKIKIITNKEELKNENKYIIIDHRSQDTIINNFLQQYFNNKPISKTKNLQIFKNIELNTIKEFTKNAIKNKLIPKKKYLNKNEDIDQFIQNMQDHYPQTKSSTIKSINYINQKL